MTRRPKRLSRGTACAVLLATLLTAAGPVPARADIAVSSDDGHTVLEDGQQVPAREPVPDSASIIDLGRFPPRIVTTLEDVPGSVAGPPMSVAVARDESFAVVTSATRLEEGRIVPDNRVSVLDLRASPPRLAQSLTAGAGAAAVRIAPDGALALVANRAEGTVSVFAIRGRRLEKVQTLDLENPKSGPSGIAFTRDGRAALVTRDGDNRVSVLRLAAGPQNGGPRAALDPRPITTGIRPSTIDVAPDGSLAAVSNLGRGDGDIDTVSLIDLTREPFRAVETVAVGRGPEGLKFSPDGRFLAVGLLEGTTKPRVSAFRTDQGRLLLLSVREGRLRRAAEAPVGRWPRGIAFSRDGRTILVQTMMERTIGVFRLQGGRLQPVAPLFLNAGPAAVRTSWP